jgi:hypothetical protein
MPPEALMDGDVGRDLAHLVGSVPLGTAAEVFRRVTGALGAYLPRVPDGETGERGRWIYWQRLMLERHPAMEVDPDVPPLEVRIWDGSVLRHTDLLRLRRSVDPATVEFATGYAEAALASWEVFLQMRQAGVVPDGRRFQVCLPTPMSSAWMYVSPSSHPGYQLAYERALMRALVAILADIPHAELSIQWDICQEVLLYENYFPSRPPDYRERIGALLARLGNAVPAAVDMGYHLCYGSPNDQHLVMPRDTAILAEIARAIFAGVRRPVNFLHLPVPKDREDPAYFAPLADLGLPARTRLYLGLIHHDDGAGDRRRLDAARRVVPTFGVATECGWGRADPARVDGFLESHRAAIEYLLAPHPVRRTP